MLIGLSSYYLYRYYTFRDVRKKINDKISLKVLNFKTIVEKVMDFDGPGLIDDDFPDLDPGDDLKPEPDAAGITSYISQQRDAGQQMTKWDNVGDSKNNPIELIDSDSDDENKTDIKLELELDDNNYSDESDQEEKNSICIL